MATTARVVLAPGLCGANGCANMFTMSCTVSKNPPAGLRNCIVAPHIASARVSNRNAMAEIAADNLMAGLTGEPLPSWVNPEVAAKSLGVGH